MKGHRANLHAWLPLSTCNMMISRLLLIIATASSLAACNPKAENQAPPFVHAMLAGEWYVNDGQSKCAVETIRFEKGQIAATRNGQNRAIFDISSSRPENSAIELVLVPAQRMLKEVRSAKKLEELEKTEIILTLSVVRDTISLRDVQVRNPLQGLHAPKPSKRNDMARMFDLRRCPAKSV